jgi:hypothetical protein
MSTNSQEELAKFNQETRDSIRGKNNYRPLSVEASAAPEDTQNHQKDDYLESKRY